MMAHSKHGLNNCFIKNPTTHNWESEQKKVKERATILLRYVSKWKWFLREAEQQQ